MASPLHSSASKGQPNMYRTLSQTKMLTAHNKIQLHLLKHYELDISRQNARGKFTPTSYCSPPAWLANVSLYVQRVYVKRAPCALMSSSLHCSVTCGTNGGTAQPIKCLWWRTPARTDHRLGFVQRAYWHDYVSSYSYPCYSHNLNRFVQSW